MHTGVVLVMPAKSGSTGEGLGSEPTDAPPLVHAFSCTTTVEFDVLSKEVIDTYIASGEKGRALLIECNVLCGCAACAGVMLHVVLLS